MLMTAVLKDNGLFIPNIDKSFWQNQADANGLLNLDITPAKYTKPKELKAIKKSHAGILAQYANPDLIPLEQKAVDMAMMDKCGVKHNEID